MLFVKLSEQLSQRNQTDDKEGKRGSKRRQLDSKQESPSECLNDCVHMNLFCRNLQKRKHCEEQNQGFLPGSRYTAEKQHKRPPPAPPSPWLIKGYGFWPVSVWKRLKTLPTFVTQATIVESGIGCMNVSLISIPNEYGYRIWNFLVWNRLKIWSTPISRIKA